MSLDETAFEARASRTLEHFMDVIDAELGDDLDVDLEGGILTIELESGGQYVINKHGPNRQIWMSSPKSGATHYDYDADRDAWTGTRDGADLATRLAGELAALTGTAVSLDE